MQPSERRVHAGQANKQSGGERKTKSSKQEGLFKQVAKAVSRLAANPRHSSLHTHEYDSLERIPSTRRGRFSRPTLKTRLQARTASSGATDPERVR